MATFRLFQKNSFKKAQKQAVTTKPFLNVHFCSLGMKTYRFQLRLRFPILVIKYA